MSLDVRLVPDLTLRWNKQVGTCVSYLYCRTPHSTLERPLEDATTANLWKTLFTLVVELSLRSGLVTEEEFTSTLAAPAGSKMTQLQVSAHDDASQVGMKNGTDDHEIGEESAKEEDLVVEFV